MMAAMQSIPEVAQFLIDRGADVRFVDNSGRTARGTSFRRSSLTSFDVGSYNLRLIPCAAISERRPRTDCGQIPNGVEESYDP